MDPTGSMQGGDGSGSSVAPTTKTIRRTRYPPNNYATIVKDAVKPFDRSSLQVICEQLYSGVLLSNNTKKYWVDKHSNKNCFTVFAKTLDIAWAGMDNNQYWIWMPVKESSDGDTVEAACLVDVCLFVISGSLHTSFLSGGIVYEIIALVMIKRKARFNVPMTLEIGLPNGKTTKTEYRFDTLKPEKWWQVCMGEFLLSPDNAGSIHFKIHGGDGYWLRGFVIKGVSFRPKNY